MKSSFHERHFSSNGHGPPRNHNLSPSWKPYSVRRHYGSQSHAAHPYGPESGHRGFPRGYPHHAYMYNYMMGPHDYPPYPNFGHGPSPFVPPYERDRYRQPPVGRSGNGHLASPSINRFASPYKANYFMEGFGEGMGGGRRGVAHTSPQKFQILQDLASGHPNMGTPSRLRIDSFDSRQGVFQSQRPDESIVTKPDMNKFLSPTKRV